MDLVSYMFFEKQEHGTSLCGQHALNNVLQSHYFEATDLAAIAQQLDEEENDTLDSDRLESVNMDDTGFFSVQVLDRCLQVWGLKLERWRSEEMKPFWGRPESQDAFILNLSQHWFPLRKFASSKRWYNLNSFNDAPQHVSELYLGLTLNQAETEGYSVFVLRPLTEGSSSSESILHTSRADRVAGQLGGSGSAGSSAFAGEGRSTGSSGGVDWGSYGNFEDEDAELRAALAASVADDPRTSTSSAPSSRPIASLPLRPSSSAASLSDSDPVSSSRARAERQLEQFQRDQAAALRREDPSMALGGFGQSFGSTSSSLRATSGSATPASTDAGSSSRARRRQGDPVPVVNVDSNDEDENVSLSLPVPRRRSSATPRSPLLAPQPSGSGPVRVRHNEDEEMMRRAIEESLREQEGRDRLEANTGARNAMDVEDDNEDDDDIEEIDYDDLDDFEGPLPPPSHARAPPSPPLLPLSNTSSYAHIPSELGFGSYDTQDRNYDEEDAELQRAIRESMMGLPEGFSAPTLTEPPPLPSPFISRPPPPPTSITPAESVPGTSSSSTEPKVDVAAEEDEKEGEEEEAPALTPAEMRALRLARFG